MLTGRPTVPLRHPIERRLPGVGERLLSLQGMYCWIAGNASSAGKLLLITRHGDKNVASEVWPAQLAGFTTSDGRTL